VEPRRPVSELRAELVPDALHRRLEEGDVLRRVVGRRGLRRVHLREQRKLHLGLEVTDARCLVEVRRELRSHRSYAAFFETLAYISWKAATTPRMLSASLPSSSSPATSTSSPSTSPTESLSATAVSFERRALTERARRTAKPMPTTIANARKPTSTHVAVLLVLMKLESELFTSASAIAVALSIDASYALRRSRLAPSARSIA